MVFTKRLISTLTTIMRSIALTIMTLMMLFITAAVVSRMFHKPIVGDIELVQLGMVALIMCGLAYTEQIKGHISIEIIVEKLPQKVQLILDMFAYLLTIFACTIIVYVYYGVAIDHKTTTVLSTNLLQVPYYPFDWLITLGFLTWGLESLLGLIESIILFFK